MAQTFIISNPGVVPVGTDIYDGVRIVPITLAPAGSVPVINFTPKMALQITAGTLNRMPVGGPFTDPCTPAISGAQLQAIIAANNPAYTNRFATMLDVGGVPITAPMQYKGTINVAGDFPGVGVAQAGWTYRVTGVAVTDPVTGKTVYRNDWIVWDGGAWQTMSAALTSPLIPKGTISLAADFPLPPTNPLGVRVGWLYRVLANVTDNDPAKTNTLQSFLQGEEIAWGGVNWINYGATSFVASAVAYDGAASLMTASELQEAVDEAANFGRPATGGLRIFYVAKGGNDAYPGSCQRPFLTIGAALTAIGDPLGVPTLVQIGPGVYAENVVINYSNIHLNGSGISITVIQPAAGHALEMRPVNAVTGPDSNILSNLSLFGTTMISGETATGSGVFFPGMCLTQLVFVRLETTALATFFHVNHAYADSWFANDISLDQCAVLLRNDGNAQTITVTFNPLDPNPNTDPSNNGFVGYGGMTMDLTLNANGVCVLVNHTVQNILRLNFPTSSATIAGGMFATILNPGAGAVAIVPNAAYPAWPVALTGAINPNGVVTGVFGQTYRDTVGGIWYICDSNPSGTVWSVI